MAFRCARSEWEEKREHKYHQHAEEQLQRESYFYIIHKCVLTGRHDQRVSSHFKNLYAVFSTEMQRREGLAANRRLLADRSSVEVGVKAIFLHDVSERS